MPAAPSLSPPPSVFVWREAGFDPSAYSGVHALAPISLGLAVPALALLYAVPEMIAYWALMISLYLLVIFVLTGVIFVRSVFRAESIAEVRFDALAKTVVLTRKGSFGNTVEILTIDSVADAYFHVRYDDDGYKVVEPRILLKSGEAFVIPGDVTAQELDSVRRWLASRQR